MKRIDRMVGAILKARKTGMDYSLMDQFTPRVQKQGYRVIEVKLAMPQDDVNYSMSNLENWLAGQSELVIGIDVREPTPEEQGDIDNQLADRI